VSTTTQETGALGTTSETAGLRIVTYSGDEIDYSSGRNLRRAMEDSSIFSPGRAEGAVVTLLGIDDFEDMNRIQVDSPMGQSDLETIERTIALLKEVRAALRTTVAA
jgi:hypothetical protein